MPIRDEHASRDMPADVPSCQRASDYGKSERSWLAVRDDFRNWLTHAA